MPKQAKTTLINEFLKHSNWIEQERSEQALDDAWRAWKFAKANMDDFDVDYVLKIHQLLMRNLNPYIVGKFRDCDVMIGGKRKVFTSEYHLKSDLKEVILLMLTKVEDKVREDYAKHCHIMFEAVHPFVDGNGRTGRILWNIHRLRMGLPIQIIHSDWPKEDGEQINYYKWFKD